MFDRYSRSGRAGTRGQVLVIFVGGLLALIAGIAFVVDGGNAMAQQRVTQNGVDASAQAGTVVIAQYLMGGSSATGAVGTCPTTPGNAWDLEVCKSVYGSAAANGVAIDTAEYTDFKGDPIGTVGAGNLPTGAQGVKAVASKQFDTYFARALGISTFTATTQATAVTGVVTQVCPPGVDCGVIPLTVPVNVSTCGGNGILIPGQDEWPWLGTDQADSTNEAIVPICKDKNNDIGGGSAGSVGWLDLSTAIGVTTVGTCANNFKDAVLSPCIAALPFPTWIQTFPGGVGKGGPAIQDALNTHHGNTVQIPLFDGTCKTKPPGTGLLDCPNGDIGVGANTWYHIPTFASFLYDQIFLNGNDRKQCDLPPGLPYVGGNGSNGCLKGWWVEALVTPGAIDLGPISPGTTNPLGVQLIR